MKQLLTIITLAALSGCVADGRGATDDLCGAEQLKYLVGQDAGDLSGLELPENRRIVRPGMAVTADFQPDRLNIGIDQDNVIERLWCT
ncbi:I78 family peptidase inhibitor [Aliiroseovarius sp. S253]|uniref:I78 family peptidase inhibitor n=1 Tax=Aliiroseovarius sp. S253 TaxID=3415133 RepID=UPI003C7BEC1A